MNINPVEIDINEWEKFGGGFTADSFYKKGDDSVMLKLYADFMPPREAYNELLVSENVEKLGVPIAKAYEYVKSGKHYGAVFERIKNKRSIARILADEPGRIDEMAKLFSDMLKKLHSTACDTDAFSDMHGLVYSKLEKSSFLTETQKAAALKALEAVPGKSTCVHGDCHIGNVILAENGSAYFIDLADFAYGNPIFDLGTVCFTANYIPDGMCMNLYHIHLDVMQSFWKSFVHYYFDGEDLDSVNERLKAFAGFQAVHFAAKANKSDDVLDAVFEKTFGK